MAKDQLETIEKRLLRSRIEFQSLRQNQVQIKKENLELKKRLKTIKLIHNATPAGICFFQQGKLIEMNQTAISMLGYRPEEILGHKFTDIIHPDHRSLIKEKTKNWLAQKKISDMLETCLITKNNDSLYCDLRMTKIRLNGRTTFIVCLTSSEERKKWEKESLSREKNIALINLSSGIAGRLSQYLQPLSESLDGLRQMSIMKDDRFKESLYPIEDTTNIIQKTIRQLNLLNSKPHPSEKLSPQSINDLIQKAIAMVKSGLVLSNSPHSNEIGFKTFYRSKSTARLNPEEIEEAFTHLLINACEAMSESGDIFITTEESDGLAHIYIQDNGIGIPEGIMDRIFDPFFTSRGQHSGLGLSIAQSIIKRHNGFIDVTSLQDHGTTFHIQLPLAETVSFAPDRVTKNKKIGDNQLLVIHQDPVLRELISQLFSDKGCRVINAETGHESLYFINRLRFDLLITDTKALGQNRDLVINRYKKRNENSSVVFITPKKTEEETRRSSNSKIDLMIKQPIDLNQFVKEIVYLLKKGRVH